MAHPQIAAFARLAEGVVEPTRRIDGQRTQLGRTMHGIAYDEIHDEIVVPQQFSQAILTFRGGAEGEEAPIRKIQGPRTQLRRPDRVVVDPVHNEIFVGDGKSAVLVFPSQANGDVAPIRKIHGPDTQLGPSGSYSYGGMYMAVDPVNDVLVLLAPGEKILIFNRTDNGNVKPRAVINGGGGRLAVYPPLGRIVVVSGSGSGTYRREEGGFTSGSGGEGGHLIRVWSVHDNGDVPPLLRFEIDTLRSLRGLALDPKNKTVIVTDKNLNAVLSYSVPEIFEE